MKYAPKGPKGTDALGKKLMKKGAHKDAKQSKDDVADMEKDYTKKITESSALKKAIRKK